MRQLKDIVKRVRGDRDTLLSTDQPPEQGRTCKVCHYPEWIFELTKDFWHTVDLDNSSLINTTAAKSTCLGCDVLRAALDLAGPIVGPRQDRKPPRSMYIYGREGHLFILVNLEHMICVDVFTLPDEPLLPAIRVAPSLPKPHLEDNLELMTSWLEKCQEKHAKCRDTTSFRPPKLLAISSEHTVRLVEQRALAARPEEAHASFRYACLSHCWGRTRSKHITTTSNLSTNLQGIPIAELPLTFRDAITIARALGIFHLWIDSLCIVQDDAADWGHHVESMADIYRNAYITLAAGDSVDDDGGFFVEGDQRYTQTQTLRVQDRDSSPLDLHLRLLAPHPNSWCPSPSTSPLEQRGWIFQERFLSRRFLCFKGNEIQWECLEDVACTCSSINGCFNARYHPSHDGPAFPDCQPVKWNLARLEDLKEDEIGRLWQEMVAIYSQKLLTFEKDKLPALAGLAKAFAEASGNTYTFGHWREMLQQDITWERFCDNASFGRPRPDVPSWSWAAAADSSTIYWSNPVNWRSTSFQVVGIEGKRLTLHGLISSVRLEISNDPNDYRYAAEHKLESLDYYCMLRQLNGPGSITSKFNVSLDKALKGGPATALRSVGFLTSQQRWSFAADYRFWNSVQDLQASLNKVYFLDLSGPAELRVAPKYAEVGQARGMILRKTEVGTYERLGILTFMLFSELPHRKIFYPNGTWQTISIS